MLHCHIGGLGHDRVNVLFHLRNLDILDALDPGFEVLVDLRLLALLRGVIGEQIEAVELLVQPDSEIVNSDST